MLSVKENITPTKILKSNTAQKGEHMLINLHVKNLALIKEVDIDFSDGLIVLTGETGAGKSLILGSVNIALGNKVTKDLIRRGEDFALVELTFKVDDSCLKKLKKFDIYIEDENIITVSRRISEQRSQSKINGETVNVKVLRQVMEALVDIHGQHEHQSLLYKNNHLIILDKFAKDNIKDILSDIKAQYLKYSDLKNKLKNYDIDDSKRTREIEFARFEVDEIDAAGLEIGEDEELENKYKKLSNGRDIVSNLSQIYNYLSYESNGGAGEIINRAIMDINNIKDMDEKLSQFQNSLYDIDSLCRDLVSEIYDYNKELEFSPEEFYNIEERLNLINHLKLKYGQGIEKILSYRDEKKSYLDKLADYDNVIGKLNKEVEEAENTLEILCQKLSKKRKEAALSLEEQVKKALKDLNFLSVDFKIEISRKENITETGFDQVEFLISTNPGEPVKSLAKVASGGELSRIMLALKSLLAEEDEIETLIFDEIDAGISGKTAHRVAEKLAEIGRKHQVICISHLAQIAAMSDNHYLIEKNLIENSTYTTIKLLNREQSIHELVRINGDGKITDIALKHASEMKDMADRTKCN